MFPCDSSTKGGSELLILASSFARLFDEATGRLSSLQLAHGGLSAHVG